MTFTKIQRRGPVRRVSIGGMAWPAIACLWFGAAGLAYAGVQHRVSQKGRAFAPAILDVQNGDSVEFVNDDGELLHHAYLEEHSFSFDTGDQAPGSRTRVAFPTKGTFTVLCGIHPKMKLAIRVH